MGALTGEKRLGLRRVVDTDPEAVTRRRRESNKRLGLNRPPGPHEIDLYRRAGKTPPKD